MIREIKFRAWSVARKRFLYLDFGAISDEPDLKDWNLAGVKEQYTGLKDKNDKDIYEGDIVNKGYLNYMVFDEIGKVQLGILSDSDGFSHNKILGWKAGDNSLLDVCEECEIIGNIHENPELLKECEKNENR